MKFSLKNKWVLITGASSGFGAAAATAFGAEGAKLLLGARRLDRLKITAAAAKKSGAAQAHFHELDVANTASVETFIAWVRKTIKSQPLHVLVNNAGGAHGTDPVASGKDADWEAMLQSNVLGVLRMTRAALPLLPPDAGASIINIGSVVARITPPNSAVYTATKGAVDAITGVLSRELGARKIRVNSLNPGLVETEGTHTSGIVSKTEETDFAKWAASTTPLGRIGQPKDIANIAVFLASDDSAWLTGELLLAGGGNR